MNSGHDANLGRISARASIGVAFSIGVFAVTLCVASRAHSRAAKQVAGSLVAHEWGTFTSIAAPDGSSQLWRPFPDKSDLPSFVERLGFASFKGGLVATVRMETPVIYFYSPEETSVSVSVSFSKGCLTEWYPHATEVRPADTSELFIKGADFAPSLLRWQQITVSPNPTAVFPRESKPSHYYAARDTAANAVSVPANEEDEKQVEKFLFYRGVTSFQAPLSAKVLTGNKIRIESRASAPVPVLVLFERRGSWLGYRVLPSLRDATTVDTPSTSGTFDSLRIDLETILVAQGLFPDEAHAMLETWRESWFQEGSRLFYIVPRSFVDAALPLSIQPAPAHLERVFVGRIELVTSATQESLEAALASKDYARLQKYGRFLGPFLELLMTKTSGTERGRCLEAEANAYYTSLYATSSGQR